MEQPGCPRFCPGCHAPKSPPAERLDEKQAFIGNVLSDWRGKITSVREAPPDKRLGYREKVCLAAAWQGAEWRFGFTQRQALIPVHHCPIHTPRVNRTLVLLGGILPSCEQFPLVYYLQSGAQVTLVIKSRHMPDISWLSGDVTERLQETGNKGLWLHLHPAAGRRVTAKNGWHLIWGESRSVDSRGLVYGPAAFQQLIPELAEAALDKAEEFLAPEETSFVLDLYCGIGGSLRRWARKTPQVVGVEIDGESVACARINAPAVKIFRGAGRQRLPQLSACLPEKDHLRLLYANPPRTGIEPEVMCWIAEVFKPSRIACLSCNAVSLKRDLKRLTGAGYRVEIIVPFDFFPGTRYLEMMALLTRTGAGAC